MNEQLAFERILTRNCPSNNFNVGINRRRSIYRLSATRMSIDPHVIEALPFICELQLSLSDEFLQKSM